MRENEKMVANGTCTVAIAQRQLSMHQNSRGESHISSFCCLFFRVILGVVFFLYVSNACSFFSLFLGRAMDGKIRSQDLGSCR